MRTYLNNGMSEIYETSANCVNCVNSAYSHPSADSQPAQGSTIGFAQKQKLRCH